jgi:hypothetical protein
MILYSKVGDAEEVFRVSSVSSSEDDPKIIGAAATGFPKVSSAFFPNASENSKQYTFKAYT